MTGPAENTRADTPADDVEARDRFDMGMVEDTQDPDDDAAPDNDGLTISPEDLALAAEEIAGVGADDPETGSAAERQTNGLYADLKKTRLRAQEAEDAAQTLRDELDALRSSVRADAAVVDQAAGPPEGSLEQKEKAYIDAVLEGDTDTAVRLRGEINQAIREEAAREAEAWLDDKQHRQGALSALETVANTLVETYPVLHGETGDSAVIAEVVEWRDFYIAQGHAPASALQLAAEKIAPLYPAPSGDVQDERLRHAVPRNIQADKAQSTVHQLGIGLRLESGQPMDVESMSEEEFEALPAAQRRKLKGM